MGCGIESTDSVGPTDSGEQILLDKQCQPAYHHDMSNITFAPKIPGVLHWEHVYQAVYDIPQMDWRRGQDIPLRISWGLPEYLTEGPDEALVQLLYFFYHFPIMATREAIRTFVATTYLKNLNDEQIDKLHARAFNKVAEDSIWPKYEVYSYFDHVGVWDIISDTKETLETKFHEMIAGREDWNRAKDYVEEQYELGKYAQALKSIYKRTPLKVQFLILSALGRANGSPMTKQEYLRLAQSCGNCRNTALKYLNLYIPYPLITSKYNPEIINPDKKVFALK